MTPDQITALMSALKLIEMIGGWHFGTILLILFVGPWVMQLVSNWQYNKRFESMVSMYKNNATLVDQNEKLTKAYNEHLGEFKDIVMMNTQAYSQLTAAINQKQFCPMVRLENQKTRRGINE
jgi:hypothetical protein